MERISSKVTIGSKGAVLTAKAIYNVAHRLSVVELDVLSVATPKCEMACVVSSELQNQRLRSELNATDPNYNEEKGFLTDEQVRATLIVILHKLLLGRHCVRKFLPAFICKLLNGDRTFDNVPVSQEDAVARLLVHEVYLSRREAEETGKISLDLAKQFAKGRSSSIGIQVEVSDIGLTIDEEAVLLSLVNIGGFIGIAALVSHDMSSFIVFADAVAVLSFEGLQADTAFLDSSYFKQPYTSKTEVAVASDLCALLFGSKLVKSGKGIGAPLVRSVASVHGALRDAAKSLASGLSVEINREEFLDFSSHPEISAATEFSTSQASMLSVLVCLRLSSCAALDRVQMIFNVMCDLCEVSDSIKSKWEEECRVDRRKLASIHRNCQMVVSGIQSAFSARFTLAAVESWNRILAKECASALSLLFIREKLVGDERENKRNPDIREVIGTSRRTKKNFVLGKGTDMVRNIVDSYLGSCADGGNVGSPWFLFMKDQLYSCLNPGVQEYLDLVAKVKRLEESNDVGRLPKTAKGTRDFKPEDMVIREKVFGIITSIFKRHGAGALDTPVFELRETLMGKYGEDSKLIYDLADQGGELLSLRYDLTVPFARHLAMNNLENMKRYHIAKVYRRDNPSKGRYREFYQCDLDIAGQYASMVPDFEVLKVLTEILDELSIGEYEVKLNHRQLLDGMLSICGVPGGKFRSICSAIDKLDKLSWEEVCKEMVDDKGLTVETAGRIGELVQKRGPPSVLLEELKRSGSPFLEHEGSCNSLAELELLFKYLRAAKCLDRIVLDLSLARGLDYYTGVIYEAVFKGSQQGGSIAAGGRYDNLVGMFKKNKDVPAVGVSIGIERVFAIMEEKEKEKKKMEMKGNRPSRSSQTEVLVVILGTDVQYMEHAIEIVTELWEGKIRAEFKCVSESKLDQQIKYAIKTGIPWLVIGREEEISAGTITVRNIRIREERGIKREDLVIEMQRRLQVTP